MFPNCAQSNFKSGKQPLQLPIHVVYVNHVEVESVLPPNFFPLVSGKIYTTSAESYQRTRARLKVTAYKSISYLGPSRYSNTTPEKEKKELSWRAAL